MTQKFIHKFEIEPYDRQVLQLPRHAKILSVGSQVITPVEELVFLWAEVDPDAPKDAREILVVRTGDPILVKPHEDSEFLGTVHYKTRKLVFHVYEVFEFAVL